VEMVTLAHEALLVHWGRLRDWVASEREERLVIEDFEDAAKVLDDKPDPELLWRRRRLLLLEEIMRVRQIRLEGATKRFYSASVAAAQRSRIIGGVVGILVGLFALGAGTVYVDLEAKRVQAEADTAMARAEAALALAREAMAKADRERAISGQKEAEKREAEAKTALTALKLVQGSLALQAKASPSAVKEPTALDSSVVRQLDEYIVKQERDNAKLPEPLEDLLRETENIPPPVVEPGLTGAVTALPQPRGGPVARSVVLGEAYSKLSQAKVVAASCKREDDTQPKGNGKVALVIDPNGTVSAVSMDERFVGTKVGACVDRAFRQVNVQPFEGKALTVIWSFAIP
jgi:eukaryotic-like serine/threonine-protein kinase